MVLWRKGRHELKVRRLKGCMGGLVGWGLRRALTALKVLSCSLYQELPAKHAF